MSGTIKKFLIGASVAAGMSAIASTPAFAYTITGTNSTAAIDYLLFDVCPPNNTCVNQNANLDSILAGNSSSPGGNVELYASSEGVTLDIFLASKARTSIEGTVAGKNLTVSSLTAEDWFSDGTQLNINYGANTFANQWFNQFYDAAGLAQSLGNSMRATVYNAYLSDQVKGFQRSSDPNVSYISTSGSDLLIGLAGHYDAKAFYAPILGPMGNLIKDGFQVSEVVKVNYDGEDKLLYSFSATQSGLVNGAGPGADGKSHTGNYEVKLTGMVTPPPPTADVPEPSAMLALIGLGGFLASKRKQAKNA